MWKVARTPVRAAALLPVHFRRQKGQRHLFRKGHVAGFAGALAEMTPDATGRAGEEASHRLRPLPAAAPVSVGGTPLLRLEPLVLALVQSHLEQREHGYDHGEEGDR